MKKLMLLITFLFTVVSFGQDVSNVNLIDYVREIQIWEKEGTKMSFTFWIPKSYWKIALRDNPQIPVETIQKITSTFEEYVFVCGLDLKMNLDGTMSFTEEANLRNSISLEDSNGTTYVPLSNDQVSIDALEMAESLKPMFKQMLGQMGAGMHFYFFKITDADSNNSIDAYKEGNFTIKHSNKQFKYVLPLTTLMPSKKCSVDNATMKGNWKYCPMHGTSL